jgi:hypothetical protein
MNMPEVEGMDIVEE